MNWKLFWGIKDFLAVNDAGYLILWENRIVLPSIYQNLAVNLAHVESLEVTKSKALLRSKVFFPNMDKITTLLLDLFTSCKSVNRIPVYLQSDDSSKSEIYYFAYWRQNKYWEYKQ